ncbi:fucose permease [Glaciihabitans tibetensis]|uniref:Fucose permease n=1 Tax=Glaciihabitans tibetensis TaxID=1266600 RepID=A0A2T0VCJ8_9MICO|nr:MFS transporter [Glaciihabitans tibetensis]PRY67909.1 fucose permease [Glaciihabitans tibetensis]
MAQSSASAAPSEPLDRAAVIAWRNALFVIFALCGLGLASWVARVPAVRDALGVSLEQMGVLIFGIAAGSIVGLLASSHVIARFGTRTTMTWLLLGAGIGLSVAGLGATFGPSFAVIFAGLALFGICTGMTDVAMNVSGAANERLLGRATMPIFHAFFSFGTIVGAALGALAEFLDLPIAVHMIAISVLIVVAVLVAVRSLRSEHLVADGEEPIPVDDHSKTWRGRLSIWRDPRTILIGLIILGMAFAEGSANDWLGLAMVDGHGVSNATGAVVFGVFVTAMTVGRLLGVRLLDRFGRVPVLRGSAALAAVGLLIVIFGPTPGVAIVGSVLWGLGSALGFPVGMSAAADDPRTAAARVSAVATIGYFAFLVGPPLIGFLAEQVGILNSLLVVLVLVAVSGIVSYAAREPRATETKPAEPRPAGSRGPVA